MDKEEIYLTLYKENLTHTRHHESQRTTMSNILLIITAGIGSIISMDKSLTVYDLPFSIFIILLGSFGIIFTKKYGSREADHLRIANRMIQYISPEIYENLIKTRKNVEKTNKYSIWIKNKSLTEYWVVLHTIIIFIGVMLSIFIMIKM